MIVTTYGFKEKEGGEETKQGIGNSGRHDATLNGICICPGIISTSRHWKLKYLFLKVMSKHALWIITVSNIPFLCSVLFTVLM